MNLSKVLKELTEDALDFLAEEGLYAFNTPNDYIEYALRETNLHDSLVMINALVDKIDGYVLSQDNLLIVGNMDNVYLDAEDILEQLDYEGKVWEEE